MMSCSHLHELILDPPGLGPHVEPDEDVGECLQEQDRVPQFLRINTYKYSKKTKKGQDNLWTSVSIAVGQYDITDELYLEEEE